jgi:hypothetical protein
VQALLPIRLPVSGAALPADIAVGDRVGAGRVPYKGSHPSCWGTPWAGTLLAQDDPEAWAGTIAFGDGVPEQLRVSMHVRDCREAGILPLVPVRWDFGKVLWERPESLRTVEADVAAFEAEREAARR